MVGGALLVFLGLQVAGVINVRALWRDTRVDAHDGRRPRDGRRHRRTAAAPAALSARSARTRPGYPRSFVFGLLFAAGWSPCIGPILGGILGLATATASVAPGTVLLVAYAAGLAIPFLAVALGASWVSQPADLGRPPPPRRLPRHGRPARDPGRADAHQHTRTAGRRSARRSGSEEVADMTHEVNTRPLPPAAAQAPAAAASPSAMDRVDRGLEGLWHFLSLDARGDGADAAASPRWAWSARW